MSAPHPLQSTYVFEGREVTLPVIVRDACSASATYLVRSDAVRRLVAIEDLDVAEVLPGRTLFTVAAIDYRDNDLGDYNELSLSFFVRERRDGRRMWTRNMVDFFRSRLPTYIHRLPVNQSFTCAAGVGIWGFPKSVETIEIERTRTHAVCSLHCDGKHVLTLTAPTGGRASLGATEMVTYSRIEGRTHRTRFVSQATGVGFRFGGAHLELGDHPVAEELRTLGLPKRPLLSVWLGHMRATFEAPEPI